MMAVRGWSDGDILTGAAMDELTRSTYLRFADAVARDAFLVGDLAPVPGMKVCMLDSGQTLTYIVVGGIGYWAPQPGTLMFNAVQNGAQVVNSSNHTALYPWITPNANRNWGGWLDVNTGKFSPKVPGIYEFFGGVGLQNAAQNVYQRTGFRLNGSGNTPMHLASENRTITPVNAAVSYSARKFEYPMNGTTDYMELVTWSYGANNTAGFSPQPGMVSSFGAKYQGM